MLAYAANQIRPAGRTGSPKALTMILVGHAVLIAAVMSAKMDIVPQEGIPIVELIPLRPDPSPPPPEPAPQTDPKPTQNPVQDPVIAKVEPIVPMGQPTSNELDTHPVTPLPPTGGGGPVVLDPPRHVPVKLGPRFATNATAIKPPYPLDKMRGEEEATLKLRLTIDVRGRVTAVDPVGFADPSFLEAARRHIIRSWRYKPATEDGVAVPSSTVISLSFRMEDV